MKRFTAIFIILLFFTSLTYAGRTLPWIELTFSPAKVTEAAQKYRLLPTTEEKTDDDAAALYQKAIRSLPQDYQPKQFSDLRRLPPDQLSVEQVESSLNKLKSTLDLLYRATRSKQCNWPFVKPGQVSQQFMDDLSKYRQFAFILDVQTKLQIAQGRYDQAKETLKTSLAMAKHLGDAPTLVQGMVGIAIAALSQRRIEQWIQSDNALNLYWALEDLPQPLADVKKAIKIETDNLKNYNFLLRRLFKKQLKHAHDRVLVQMNYVDRKIAALQCIEALRLYAGTNDGKFPEKLIDITDIKVPVDPVTKKSFSYKSTGSEAVLELEATEGSDGRDAVRYELKLKE
jgi:tetratricopeptide (TPR) repeat protein